jgi:hypothetical protein
MRFGKTNGIALILLGIALLITQAVISLHPQSGPSNPSVNDNQPRTTRLPAIIGGGIFIVGIAIFISNRHRPD